ncbi:MAG: hypothetical protein K8T10_13630 [Candidatus Eremiobacteraeota bacterium]|nr:hypothetical protein [Candidatus Eremiobacteraeota bacterium]
MSLFYIVFLCLFVGVIINLICKSLGFIPKIITTLIINILFALLYVSLPTQTLLSKGYYIDFMLMGKIIPNIINNIHSLLFPLLIIPLAGFLGVSIGSILKKNKKTERIVALIFLTVFVINFFIMGFSLNANDFSRVVVPPESHTYSFDGHIYLRTFHLMKAGNVYYESFQWALTQRQGSFTITSVFNIRPPFLFHFWELMPPDGMYVALLFVIMAAIMFFASYFTVNNELDDPLVAIITPVLMSYLFVYGICGNWFTFHEYWAWFFLSIAIWAKQRKYNIVWISSFIICLFIRELFFFVWIVFIMTAFLNKNKKETLQLLLVFVVSLIYYMIHYYFVSKYISISTNAAGGLSFHQWFQGSTTFAGRSFLYAGSVLYKPVLFGFFIVTMYAFASLKIFRERLKLFYPLTIIPLAGVIYLFMGIPPVTYWGLLYLPCFSYLIPFFYFSTKKEIDVKNKSKKNFNAETVESAEDK